MNLAAIALGSNLGDRFANLDKALASIEPLGNIWDVSPFAETAPVGGPPGQGLYLNAVALLRTAMAPETLLQALLAIELDLGRTRVPGERNAARLIDLDLLFYDQQIISTSTLELPHPRLHERPFILKPLIMLAPDWVHPVFGKTAKTLLGEGRNMSCIIKDSRKPDTVPFSLIKGGQFFQCKDLILWLRLYRTTPPKDPRGGVVDPLRNSAVRLMNGDLQDFKDYDLVTLVEKVEMNLIS